MIVLPCHNCILLPKCKQKVIEFNKEYLQQPKKLRLKLEKQPEDRRYTNIIRISLSRKILRESYYYFSIPSSINECNLVIDKLYNPYPGYIQKVGIIKSVRRFFFKLVEDL